MSRIDRLAQVCCAVLALAALSARAAEYPEKPSRFVRDIRKRRCPGQAHEMGLEACNLHVIPLSSVVVAVFNGRATQV